MEEKEIIKGNSGKNRIIGLVLLAWAIIRLTIELIYTSNWVEDYYAKYGRRYYDTVGELVFTVTNSAFDVFVIFFVIGIFLINISTNKITVTDKRVYGRALFKKQVDLPLDSISAVGTGLFKSIGVATSSGRISFMGISNRDDVHKAITKLIIDRQSNPTPTTQIKQEIQQSSADELGKFKDLYDKGVITKEEFEAKKKQLLGL